MIRPTSSSVNFWIRGSQSVRILNHSSPFFSFPIPFCAHQIRLIMAQEKKKKPFGFDFTINDTWQITSVKSRGTPGELPGNSQGTPHTLKCTPKREHLNAICADNHIQFCFRLSHNGSSSSILATMRFCSARGGSGKQHVDK